MYRFLLACTVDFPSYERKRHDAELAGSVEDRSSHRRPVAKVGSAPAPRLALLFGARIRCAAQPRRKRPTSGALIDVTSRGWWCGCGLGRLR